MQISKYRDLTLIDMGSELITIACDSCGGIGESEMDIVKISNDVVGYFTARVCLFETISFGADPIAIVNNFCVGMESRGQGLLKGINRAIDEYNKVGFNNKIINDAVTGSTEENFKTLQTALGVTVIGKKGNKIIREEVKDNDYVISIGLPKVGNEVIEDIINKKNEIVSFNTLKVLINEIGAKDILPVGSKGILYELTQIEKVNNININIEEKLNIDIKKSSGPATTILAVIAKDDLERLKSLIKEPVHIVGKIEIKE